MSANYFKDIIITGPSDTWVDSRAYNTIHEALVAQDSKKSEVWLTKDDSLTSDFTEDLSGVDLVVKKGKTLTLDGISVINFNIVVEDGGQIALDQDCTIFGNIKSEGNTSEIVAFDAITGDEILTINGSINAGLWQIFGNNLSTTDLNKVNIIYPEWWGAVGDGDTDDFVPVQRALCTIAKNGIGTIRLSKLYAINTMNPNYAPGFSQNLLVAYAGYNDYKTMRLVANAGCGFITSLLTDSANMSQLLEFRGNWENVIVDGVSFINTHIVTPIATSAITAHHTSDFAVKNLTIKNCNFLDFSRPIGIYYCDGAVVSNNSFALTNGRDSGTIPGEAPGGASGDGPNVAVWLYTNSRNSCVVNNYYNGCLSEDVTVSVTNMAGDGFVYGATHNAIVCNNIIRNFSFEGIFLSSNAEDIAGAIISNNYIDGSRVNGTTTSKFNLGIRCDKQYSEISNNTIYNASLGILLGVNELYMNTGVTVSNNTIKVSDSETRNGISLFRTTEHSTITNNTIIFPSYNKASIVNNASGIFNAGNYNTIEGNIVKALLKTTSTGPLYGIELNNLSNDTYISNNRFYNLDAGIYRSDLGGATNSLGYNNFVSCTLNYSGLWNTGVNILGCMKVVFTPTAGNVGYYRIASAVGLLQGKIRIVAFFDNKSTDTILDVCSKGYRTSTDIEQVNIIRSSPYNLGVISEVRTSTSGGTVYLDIYISSATDPDEVAITLSETVPGVYLESVPIFNPVVGSYPRITGVTTGLTTSHTLNIVDGIVDPVGSASLAKIYVDSADGDLKIKFSDGTTKLIVTD